MQERIPLPNWVEYHGPTNPQALHEQWFPSAAGLITLSTHDEGRPQVMLEAMAAGLPVVALDTDAHRDFVCHLQNGYLVSSKAELLEAIEALNCRATNLALGCAAREWIVRTIGNWDDCASKYVEAYRAVVA
jgi:glycosyltransferase involved in cell wall biosynthesis